MATPSRIHLTPATSGVFSVPGLTLESADETSRLLNENHEKYHIFFNEMGFHNHRVHHLLTIFALGASPETIRRQYEYNQYYQRPPPPVDMDIVDKKLGQPTEFKKYLGQARYYRDYLLFFQKEMERMPGGYKDVLNEYVWKGDERADDLLGRLFAGVLHPLIHLGFGVEFEQPAIVAEALALTATSTDWLSPFLFNSEKAARERRQKGEKSKTLFQLLQECQANEKLSKSARWEDTNKQRDGVLSRAPEEMIKYASQWHLRGPEELEQRCGEMYDFASYFTGAAQRPPKPVKLDFFNMHSVNCSIFMPAFLEQDWISGENKVRLLELKGRNDLLQYVSCGTPKLLLNEITDYKPRKQSQSNWDDLFNRVKQLDDDGHAAKLIRAIAKGHEVAAKYEKGSDWQIKGDAWLKLANMALDSVEDGQDSWAWDCGFDQAWERFKDRPQSRL